MTKILPKCALLCIMVMLAAASAISYAYSGVFLVKLSGTLERTVFNFYALEGSESTFEARLISLIVQKRTESGWEVAWRVQGESTVSSVSYGVIPSGMAQSSEAIKFSTGCKYRVIATSESVLGPNLYATSYFSFDEDGKVVQQRGTKEQGGPEQNARTGAINSKGTEVINRTSPATSLAEQRRTKGPE